MNIIELIDSEIADLQTTKRVLLKLATVPAAVDPPKALETTEQTPAFRRPWKKPEADRPKAGPLGRASLVERVAAYLLRNGPKTTTELARALGEDGRSIRQPLIRVAKKLPDNTWEANAPA